MKKEKPNTYCKSHSFDYFYSCKGNGVIDTQRNRSIRILSDILKNDNKTYFFKILTKALEELKKDEGSNLKINQFVAEELEALEDNKVSTYLFHRYRYDIFPKKHEIDDNPPLVQIEPSSICNYRCIFCYQSYFSKHKEMMGSMNFDLYKKIVDEINGNVGFISLASRGEPFICKDINKMLEYNVGKFVSSKINTNGSILTEENIHAVLSGGVSTIVFSAESCDEKKYLETRVNGSFKKVVKNIKLFQKIKHKHYKFSKIISRVSGVKINNSQNMENMKSFWSQLVDQVVFVKYMPWENIYENQVIESEVIKKPCSQLWLRTFVWYDGEINPCDSDFLSYFSMGNINDKSISSTWKSNEYQELRENHLSGKRNLIFPCRNCISI